MRIYIECPAKDTDKPRLVVVPQFGTDEESKYAPLFAYLDGLNSVADLDGDVFNFDTILHKSTVDVDESYITDIESYFWNYDCDEETVEQLAKIATVLWSPSLIDITEDLGVDWQKFYTAIKKMFD